jgi:hypothetical protein
MMSVAATPVSAGWYADPDGSSGLRWFDGDSWTDLVADPPGAVAREPELEPEPEPPAPEPVPLVRPEPVPEPEPEPELPPAAEEEPAEAAPRRRVPRALVYGVATLAIAGAAAGGTVALTGDDGAKPSRKATVARADPECLRAWNTTETAGAADLRVTVGQFADSYARVGRVQPLPGTLMQPDSCALTIYQPDTDTHLILIAGVKDQVGYVDATTYPRAAQLGWPRSASESNVTIKPDGTLRGIRR